MIAYSPISILMSIIFFTYDINTSSTKSYTIWFFEIVNLSIILPAIILLLLGFDELRNNVGPQNNKMLKSIRITSIIFLVVYVIFTTISLPIHITDSGYGWITIAKNLVVIIFISAIMFQTSFLFNGMQKLGYPTRMLFVPLIFLPVPSFIGLILGFCVLAYPTIFNNIGNHHALAISIFLIYTYLSLCLLATFIEFIRIVSKLIFKVEEHITTSTDTTESKKEKKKATQKEKSSGKAIT